MGLFDRGKTQEQQRKEAEQRQHDRQIEQQAMSTASQAASQKMEEVTENANFLRELRRAGIDTDKFGWLEDEIGPETADAHSVANRGEEYEAEIKWGNIGKAEQHVVERSPGRLCKNERSLAIARGTHKRRDKTPDSPLTVDEKRALRSAYQAVTSYQSLGVEGRGSEVVGETTVNARREVQEQRESAKEKAGGLLS